MDSDSSDHSRDPNWDPNMSNDSQDLDPDLDSANDDYDSDVSEHPNEPIQDENNFVFTYPYGGVQGQPDQRANPLEDYNDVPASIGENVPNFRWPWEAFSYILNNEVVQHVVDCTNERAAAFLGDNPRRKINSILWKPIDVPTMYIFFALCMVMGVVRLPRIHMYWSHDICFGGPAVFCASVMSRNKYSNIMKFLRFSHVYQVIRKQQKSRIEPILDLLRERCKEMVHPGLLIAIDDALILYKG